MNHLPIACLAIFSCLPIGCNEKTSQNNQLEQLVMELKSHRDLRELAFQINRYRKGQTDINALYAGRTALERATALGEYDTIELLLQLGANPNDPSCEQLGGKTPLLSATEQGKLEIATLLISKGADVNIKGSKVLYSQTPLMVAISQGQKDIAELLLAKGADTNAKNSNGIPLIFYMLESPEFHEDLLRNLIAHGADLNIQDQEGNTFLQEFKRRNYVGDYMDNIKKYLINKGAK